MSENISVIISDIIKGRLFNINPKRTGLLRMIQHWHGGGVFPPPSSVKLDLDILES